MSAAITLSASESLWRAENGRVCGAIPGMPEGLSKETQVLWRNLFQQLSTRDPGLQDPLLNLRLAGVTTMLLLAARLEARILSALEAENTPLPPAALIRETCRLKAQAIQALEEIRRDCASEPMEPPAMSSADPVLSGMPAGRRQFTSGTDPRWTPEKAPVVPEPDDPAAAPLLRPETDSDRSPSDLAHAPVARTSPLNRSVLSLNGPIGRFDYPGDPAFRQAAAIARQYEDAWANRLSRGKRKPLAPDRRVMLMQQTASG